MNTWMMNGAMALFLVLVSTGVFFFATTRGALLVTTIRNGLNILGVNAFWQYVVNGMVIIGAVAVDQYRRRR